MEYYSAIKMRDILPFVTTQIDPEGILLSDINQTEKEKKEKEKKMKTHRVLESESKETKTKIKQMDPQHLNLIFLILHGLDSCPPDASWPKH